MAVIYLKTTTQTVSPIKYISLKLKRVLRFSELFRNDLLFIVKLDSKKAHGLLVAVDSTWRSKARYIVQRSNISWSKCELV